MKYKYRCNCGEVDHVWFYAGNALKATQVPPTVFRWLENCSWTVDEHGNADDPEGNYIEPFFDKNWIYAQAQEFARNFVEGKTELWCGECGQPFKILPDIKDQK